MADTITNTADQIDMEEVTDRFEELEPDFGANGAKPSPQGDEDEDEEDEDDRAEFKLLDEVIDELRGRGGDHQWRGSWFPRTLIRESYFVEAMQQLVSDIGDLPPEVPGYLAIDWEKTADNLKVDYAEVEIDGVTYLYR